MKAFVAEGDNNEHYSDHTNWFIAVGTSIEAIETKIRTEYSENYVFGSEHPIEKTNGNFTYEWELYEKDEIDWNARSNYNGRHVTVYIHIEDLLE